MACRFCEDGTASYRDSHPACLEEYDRRIDRRMCVRCGAVGAASYHIRCDECSNVGYGQPLLGFPPDGA